MRPHLKTNANRKEKSKDDFEMDVCVTDMLMNIVLALKDHL